MTCNNTFDMEIDQGTTYRLMIDVEDTNLTGYSVRSHVKRSYKSDVISLDLEDYLTITDAMNGKIFLSIPKMVTMTLDGDYVYDMEIESSGGEVTRILRGTVSVSPSVTT